ncbi:VanZ family protein [Microcoleus sp. FACHB-68]|uniref:VanZ family protein n=1 Tax=Microcoleus sp. FACHB-68 TaxID=2692826 RepID=UPI001683BB69|nr:VanZ family protein [Microcoleus sp. FACHB-68]MBD1940150.1 VanZ family protein [Microcoleus sp. FACHB-68]
MKVRGIKKSNLGWIIAFFGFFAILLLIMLLADLGRLPLPLFQQEPFDKVGHFCLYGIASFLSHRAINRRMMAIFNYPIPLGPFIFSLFTAFEETLQATLPNRSASFLDFAASMAGIIVFYWVGEVWDRKRQK